MPEREKSPKERDRSQKEKHGTNTPRVGPKKQPPTDFHPAYLMQEMERCDPETARKIIADRPIPKKVYTPSESQPPIMGLVASAASNTPAGARSVPEQARALRYDVDLIYQFLTTSIDWLPVWGAQKGALGCLVDGCGGSFDISALMVELLTESGYDAEFVIGDIELDAGYIGNWLGCLHEPAYIGPRILTNGGIPNTYTTTGVDTLDTVTMSHCWVRVDIGGTWFHFDPSLKSYIYSESIDLADAMGYDQSTHMSDALSGATSTSDYIENLNRGNIRSNLSTYAENLLDYIRTNNPTATLDQVIGGRIIDYGFFQWAPRDTSLWYQSGTPTTETSIPNSYRCTLRVQYFSIDETFYSDEIYGRRLTLSGGSTTNLKLDGTTLATTSASSGLWNVTLTIAHNAYSSLGYNRAVTLAFGTGDTVFINHAWGLAGRGYAEIHQERYRENVFAGGASTDEDVLGEALAAIGHLATANFCQSYDIINRMANCSGAIHDLIGIVSWDGTKPVFQGFGALNCLTLDGVNFPVPETAAGQAISMHGGTIEELGIIDSMDIKAVCCARILDEAVAAGDKMYDATSSNWSTVMAGLVNWPSALTTNIYTTLVTFGHRVFMPEDGYHTWEDWGGAAWGYLTTGGALGMGYISGNLKGGMGAISLIPQCKQRPHRHCPCCEEDHPENSPEVGNLAIGNADMSVGDNGGNYPFPYILELERTYGSHFRLQDGPMGLGWTHNFDISIEMTTNCARGLGDKSPIDAVGSIVEMYVLFDLLNQSSKPFDHILTGVCGLAWWVDQLYRSSVVVKLGNEDVVFQKLPNGTFNAPLDNAEQLIDNLDGTFTHKTPQQVEINFNTDGKAASWVFPNGVTVDFTYESGLLETVSNGMGRTLTFSYSGSYLTDVSDGTRTVAYSVNGTSKLLETFTDAEANDTVYGYDSASRLNEIFKPANPSVPVLTVEYDSLNRVMVRKNARDQEWTYFLAGSRSEVVDPLGNQFAQYFDRNGNRYAAVNQLGQTTWWTFDGLDRIIRQEFPEGNALEWSYDDKNNVLTFTQIAKPGSGLDDIVEIFTYDPDWNKVATHEDGRGHVTTYSYDGTTGDLLTIERPEVNAQTPTITFTYTSRGQIETRTDETSIVTRFEYDTTTEKLETMIVDYGSSPHLNLTTAFDHNAWGDVTSITDARGNETVFEFDNERRLTQKTDPTPFEYVTKFTHDENGNQTKVERETGDVSNPWQTTETTYTVTDKVDTVTDPAGNTIVREYDDADRLWKVTQEVSATESRTTEFAYDELNRLYTVTDPSNTVTETRTYTDNGKLYQITDARSNTTAWSYDGHDRTDATVYADTSYEQNVEFDANGNVLQFLTRSGKTIENTFDPLNRLEIKEPEDQPLVTFTYDLAGRLIKANKPTVSGDASTGDFEFFFDSAGRFYRESYPDTKEVEHELDENGNRTKTIWPDSYYIERAFDELNRLTDIKLNGSSTAALHFDYDPLSRRTALVYQNGVTTEYGYELNDDMSSLEHTFVGSSVTFDYGFNKVHQLTSQSVSDGQFLWHPASGSSTTYGTATDVNQYPTVASITQIYDGNGNLTDDGTFEYGYDTENHLLSADDGAYANSYVYDPVHRQAQKEVGATSGKTRFLYDGWQRIADYDGTSGSLQNRYVYGTGLDEPLIQVAAGGTLTYLHHDRLGSIVALTNSGGTVTNRYTYSAWGENASSGISVGFTGQRLDLETGLYYFKNRYYSAKLGRFHQNDPIGYAGSGGLNLYTYVRNQPLNLLDPLGLVEIIPGATNCLGYACGMDAAVGPSKGESLQETMKKLGYKCKKVESSNDCTCPAGQRKVMVYVYKYGHNPNGQNPWTDPWIHNDLNDWHAVVQEAPDQIVIPHGDWTYVSRDWIRGDVYPRPTPQHINDPDKTVPANTKEKYCCCKC